ncbi:MAG TPA: NAD(P)-dependent oxidoreductase, partial [Candidatus Acidoferrum sp.]|nr:NAD(P)-dependent oxidoreductase [Candidatus Acidoferrum sp.]
YGPLYHSMVNAPSRLVHAAVRDLPQDGRSDPHADDWYDYCYVKDCAEALRLLQTAPLAGRFYNVGGGRACSNREVAEAVRAAVPGSAPRLADGRRAGADGDDGYLDLELMTRETGYRPRYDLRSGIAEYASWLRENDL